MYLRLTLVSSGTLRQNPGPPLNLCVRPVDRPRWNCAQPAISRLAGCCAPDVSHTLTALAQLPSPPCANLPPDGNVRPVGHKVARHRFDVPRKRSNPGHCHQHFQFNLLGRCHHRSMSNICVNADAPLRYAPVTPALIISCFQSAALVVE